MTVNDGSWASRTKKEAAGLLARLDRAGQGRAGQRRPENVHWPQSSHSGCRGGREGGGEGNPHFQ